VCGELWVTSYCRVSQRQESTSCSPRTIARFCKLFEREDSDNLRQSSTQNQRHPQSSTPCADRTSVTASVFVETWRKALVFGNRVQIRQLYASQRPSWPRQSDSYRPTQFLAQGAAHSFRCLRCALCLVASMWWDTYHTRFDLPTHPICLHISERSQ